jgi:hypothetical protein
MYYYDDVDNGRGLVCGNSGYMEKPLYLPKTVLKKKV